MDDERDTTGSAGGGIRLRLLDGGLGHRTALAPGTADGGWRVGPGLGSGRFERGAAGDAAGRSESGAAGLAGGATAANGWGMAGASGSGAWGAEAPAECVVVRNAVRAGDRHEPWTLPATAALAALADTARTAGVDVELAVRLVLECALVSDDLCASGVDPTTLDATAAAERVGGELDAASAAYLRRLAGRRDSGATRPEPAAPGESGAVHRGAGGGALGDVVTVGLPLRLSARLLAADLDALLAAAPLDRALAWETAAVLAGRTMSEWAPLTALRRGG